MANLNERYAHVVSILLPRGRAWEGQVLGRLILGLAGSFAAAHSAADRLATDAPPDHFGQFTSDWLRVLGAEGMAAQPYPERYVASRLFSTGGQSAEHYRALIARLSTSAIKFREFRPMAAGLGCGSPLYGPAWRFVVEVSDINPTEVELVKSILMGIAPAHVFFTFRTSNGGYV